MNNQPREDWIRDEEVDAALVQQMAPEDQGPFNNYGHRFLESAFIGRSFVVYRACKRRNEAEQVAVFDVIDLGLDADGLFVRMRNRHTKTELDIGHVPTRLGRYSVFAQIPAKNMMRRAARLGSDGKLEWTTDLGILFKVRNNPDFHNAGNIYVANVGDYEAKFGPLDNATE